MHCLLILFVMVHQVDKGAAVFLAGWSIFKTSRVCVCRLAACTRAHGHVMQEQCCAYKTFSH